MLSASEKIKIAMSRKNISLPALAKMTNQSRQSLYVKLRRNDLLESQITQYADALGYDVHLSLVNRETGDEI